MLAVAHRAGNELEALQDAARLGADVVEADVHLHKGRLEIRHTKALGPLPWLWDRWALFPVDPGQLLLDQLLAALPLGQTVMLDLKGVGRVGPETLRLLQARSVEHPIWVCSRWWPSAMAFADEPWARVLLSCRGRPEIARLRQWLRRGRPPFGVSVHLTMLTPALVAEIQSFGTKVLSWPVDDVHALVEARRLGIDGAITKDLDIVRELVSTRS